MAGKAEDSAAAETGDEAEARSEPVPRPDAGNPVPLDLGAYAVAEDRLPPPLGGSLFQLIGEPAAVLDEDLRFVAVNPAFVSGCGYDLEELRGHTLAYLNSGRQDGGFYENVREHLKRSGRWEGELWNRHRNGEAIPHWLKVARVRPADPKLGPGWHVAIFGDASGHPSDLHDLDYNANHDLLTGLPNRRLMHDRIHQAVKRAARRRQRLAVLCVDVDSFHRVNETFGHGVGDLVLAECAKRLARSMRGENAAGRLAGDRFLVTAANIDTVEQINRVARRLGEAVREPMTIKGRTDDLVVTGSIGIAIYPEDGDTAQRLIDNAETAALHAKRTGSGTYQFFTEDANVQVRERRSLENRLRRGLEKEEFVLHYQPRVDLRSGRITGVEALVRWRAAEDELLDPAHFIEAAENTGVIEDLGRWVFRTACIQAKAWTESGLAPIRMAVNVSPRELSNPDFVTQVRSIIAETATDPGMIELEITESTIMEHADETIQALKRLRALGIRLTADDFGTGYSSLNYLRRFPLDGIKIDRSFVADIGSESGGAMLAAAVVAVGQSLGKQVTAEGVETAYQLSFLRQQWCDEIQGFYFSRPLPADEMTALLREGRKL